jgi:hypothetical protein
VTLDGTDMRPLDYTMRNPLAIGADGPVLATDRACP